MIENDEAAFLRAIDAGPDDSAPRPVCARWPGATNVFVMKPHGKFEDTVRTFMRLGPLVGGIPVASGRGNLFPAT